jgi:xanthine dehydrogenase molybdenum-binding subunit
MLSVDSGDVEKGFAEADYIIEGIYESPFQYHVSPEPRSVICQWVGSKLSCWASTQVPQKLRIDLSVCLGIPLSSVRVISTYAVGGYGAKDPEKTATLTALLAKRTGRPVKTVFARAEDFIGTHRRTDCKIHGRLGVKRDGTITALHTTMITNFGRGSQVDYFVPAAAAVDTCSMLYRYQNTKWDGYHVITNTQDHGAFNGFGDPEAGFGIERLIDEAAEKLGMDPVDFRLMNCMRYGDRGMELDFVAFGPKSGVMELDKEAFVHYGETDWGIVGPDIDSFAECIREVAEQSGWKDKWKGWKTPVEVSGTKKRGIGIAVGMHHCMAAPPDSSAVKMNQDGSADVLSSDPDIGQGLRTAMAQVVAEVLGLRYEEVNVILCDTSVTPSGAGVFGSRGTSLGVNAAYLAAQDARRKLFEIAAPILEVKPEDLEAKDNRIYVKANPEKGMPIAELCLIGFQVTGNAVVPYPWRDPRTGRQIAPVSVAATVIEVEIDTETGELDVLKITSAHDCGRAINPQIVENQIDLSVTLGNGWVRSEEFAIDEKLGIMLNPNMLDYKIMTFLDMPRREDLKEIMVEFPTPWGPFGAKGMSETATTTQAPALANAIYNAIGVRIRGDYLTPDRILEALGK